MLVATVTLNRRLMGRDYTWEVAINIERELSPDEIAATWVKVCRKLRVSGIVALWVREPSWSNHCNYHLIVRNDITAAKLVQTIEASMPDRAELPYHKHVKPISSQWHYCRYMTKAETEGYVDGRKVSDKYEDKRLLFRSNLKLRKYGTIGRFWVKPKKQIWQGVVDREKRIAAGLEKTSIRKLARHVYEMFCRTIPLEQIKRSLGYFADAPGIRSWAAKLFPERDEPSPADGSIIADPTDKKSQSAKVEAKQDRPMRRRSRRMGGPKVFPRIQPLRRTVCGWALQWYCSPAKPVPDRLSLHPP